MSDDVSFVYPLDFQRDILRLLLADREALATLRPLLNATLFTDETLRWIADAAFTVFDAANAHPGQPSVLQATADRCPGSLDPDEVEAEVRALYDEGAPEDAVHVRGTVAEFARGQRLRAAAASFEEMMVAGQADEWVSKVNEASVAGVAQPGDDMDLAGGAAELLGTLDEMYAGAVPTKFARGALDAKLDGGGLCPGEMGVYLGWPGYHKTNLLVATGIGAIEDGRRVAHFAFEGGRRKVALRYYCSITRRTKSEVILDRPGTLRDVERWMAGTGGSLKLSFFPKETCTLAMLEAKLKRWQAFAGWTPELLIIDYPKLMKPAHAFDNQTRLQIASLYTGAQALAGRWGIPTWVAMQADRPGGEKMRAGGHLSMENAAETFEPCRDADIIVTPNQTDEEKQDGILRLHGAKVREAESGWEITVRVDPARCRILPLIEDLTPPPVRRMSRGPKPPEPADDE